MSEPTEPVHELDARRLLCPLPVIRTQNALKALPIGAQLRVRCTDPGTLHDIPTWCRLNGHHVLQQTVVEREQVFLIEKGERA